MFDPSIYENVKVVLEGALYDLDLNGQIKILNRSDLVDLSTMSRRYSLQFSRIQEEKYLRAEIILLAELPDFASEWLELEKIKPGCQLEIYFYTKVRSPNECASIQERLTSIWKNRPEIKQTLSYLYGQPLEEYHNQIGLSFGRKINEEQIEDMTELIRFVLHSLETWPGADYP